MMHRAQVGQLSTAALQCCVAQSPNYIYNTLHCHFQLSRFLHLLIHVKSADMGQRGEDCPAVTVPIIRSTGRTGRIILIVGENISCQYVRDDSFHHLSPENDDYNYVPPTDLSYLVLLVFLISLF